jgi:hypothetical protein
MNIIEIIAQDVFDKVRSRFANLEMGDQDGNTTTNPKDARFFDFDFTVEDNTLGRVSISISDIGTLKVYYGQGITENVAATTKDTWYDFLREMRAFAKRRMLRFDTRDITKGNLNKNDFQYLATNGSKESNMTESQYFGSSKTSYRTLENTKLIIRHTKPVDGEQPGARSRHINSLFIENADGERFKYPLNHLSGAKAMQRHVANGGRPYDERGQAIINMSESIAQLNMFKKVVTRSDFVREGTQDIVERAMAKLDQIRNECQNLCKQGYYEQWSNNFAPAGQVDIDEVTLEDYKDKFTIRQFENNLTDVFPLLHAIMQETSELNLDELVKEADGICEECDKDPCVCDEDTNESIDPFEEWALAVTEGSIDPGTIDALKELLDSGLTLGKDAISAIESLESIGLFNENLEAQLKELASRDPNADPSATIISWIQREDPEAAQALVGEEDQANIEPTGQQPINTREVAEVVMSFYDREHGTFPKGETGVITHIKKRFGDRAAMVAERLVTELSPQVNQQDQQDQQAFEDILKLAGVKEGVMDKVKKIGSKVFDKLGGGSEEDLIKDLQKKAGVPQTGKKPSKEKDVSEKFDPLKHVKDPTPGEKKAAKDVKRGSYPDRAAMLKSAEADGRLKK